MARRKQSRPTKRVHDETEDRRLKSGGCSWKRQRRASGAKTTAVVPANQKDPVIAEIQEFTETFESQAFESLRQEYSQATDSNKLDINGWYQGIRMITGNRYEIKVMGEFMSATFGLLPGKLVAYAQGQALLDERVKQMKEGFERDFQFSEWSMIVSQRCDAQTVHIDVPANNVQFGLILVDGTPGTRVLLNEDHGPYTVEALLEMELFSDAPPSFLETMNKNPAIQSRVIRILNAYGPLLNPHSDLEKHMVGAETLKSPLKSGDLICTSGGIPHAGPACQTFRLVMFAAASPTAADLYNVDNQYFAHSAMLFLLQAMWDAVNQETKCWLLSRLAKIVNEYDAHLISNHDYVSAALAEFMKQVSGKQESATKRIISTFLGKHGDTLEIQLFQCRPPELL